MNIFGLFVVIFATIILYLVGNPGYQRPPENEVEHVPLSERWTTFFFSVQSFISDRCCFVSCLSRKSFEVIRLSEYSLIDTST